MVWVGREKGVWGEGMVWDWREKGVGLEISLPQGEHQTIEPGDYVLFGIRR